MPVAATAAVLLLLAISIRLQALRDHVPLQGSSDEVVYMSERATSRVVFAHRTLASDLYWVRAVQYFGGHAHAARVRQANPFEPPPSLAAEPPEPFDLLYLLLDITTTLDPRFNIAYRFGAIFLSAHYPDGPGRPDLAVALLEKGLQASPVKWQYWHDIGFVYYWDLHDYLKASEAFRRGADLPGAPWWLRSMAATLLARGGDRATSRLLWQQLFDTANNEYARNAARTKLMQLKAIEDIEQLQAGLDRYAARRRLTSASWSDLLSAGAVRTIPLDPAGTPYGLAPSGRVQLSAESPLFPLPIEPETRAGQ